MYVETKSTYMSYMSSVTWASQVVLVVKNPPANAGDVREAGLGWEDPLEEGMATPSRLLA